MYIRKNMRSQEFQHCVESHFIEMVKTKMQRIQFVSIANLIQMKLMKVIYTLKSMMSQEVQHCVESQLIEGMKMKLHNIQFVLIVNLIEKYSSEITSAYRAIPPSRSQSSQGTIRAKCIRILACFASAFRSNRHARQCDDSKRH
jgi:hypothetical protein